MRRLVPSALHQSFEALLLQDLGLKRLWLRLLRNCHAAQRKCRQHRAN
ncbi:MAG: hypothetical protein ACM3PW_12435 [Chlamydiota bacterium]